MMINLALYLILISITHVYPYEYLFSNSAVYLAAANGYQGFLERLLSLGKHVNSLGQNGETPLMGAVRNGHISTISFLLTHGANIAAKSMAQNNTVFHVAVETNQTKAIEFFFNYNQPIALLELLLEEKDFRGNSPLNLAVIFGRYEIVEIFVAKGSNLETKNRLGRTPFLNACAYGHLRIVEFLLSTGANVSARGFQSDFSNTGLHLASHFGHAEVVKYLANKYPFLLNTTNSAGETALFIASFMGKSKVVGILTTKSNSVQNNKDPFGLSPLIIAASFNHLPVVNYLTATNMRSVNSLTSNSIEDLGRAMHSASAYGHIEIMKRLLNSDPSLLEVHDANKSTPLDKACIIGIRESVEFLLEADANMETINSFGHTPLLSASANGHLTVIRLLIEHGANYNFRDFKGWLCLHLAANYGHISVVEYLSIRHKELLEARTFASETPLLIAVAADQSEVVHILIKEFGANVEAQDNRSFSPLISAAFSGHLSTIETLLNLGADLFATTGEHEDSAIHIATKYNQQSVVEFFVSYNISLLTIRNNQNNTPICVSAEVGNVKTIDLLLSLGADIESKCFMSATPLIVASLANIPSTVSFLISKGCNITARSSPESLSSTALHHAAGKGFVKVMEVLLSTSPGRLIELKNLDGHTALWIASYAGQEMSIKFLLSKGADLEASDSVKRTPLFAAIIARKPLAVRYLLMKGASVDAEMQGSNFTMTPLIYSAKLGYSDVIEVLLDKYPDLVRQKSDDSTALFVAASEGNLEAVNALLFRKANTETRCKGQWTALHVASTTGHVEVVEALLLKAADIWARSGDHANTAAHLAAKFGQLNVLKVLLKHERALMESENSQGVTPIWVAANYGEDSIVGFLISESASFDEQGAQGYSPFIAAAAAGKLNVLKVLLSHGAGVYSKSNDEDGRNMAIHVAASRGNVEVVKFLLDDKADLVKAQNGHKDTALILAASSNHLDVVKVLHNSKSIVDAKGQHGWTAFLAAVARGNLDIVKYLHEVAHSNVIIRSCTVDEQRQGVHLAARFGHLNTMKYLIENRLNELESKSGKGNSPLWEACRFGHSEIADWLITWKSADLEFRGQYEWTPLLVAASTGNLDVIKLLASKGADLMAKSDRKSHSKYAIHLAVENGHIPTTDYFIGKLPEMLEIRNRLSWTPLLSACASGHLSVLRFLVQSKANVRAVSNSIDGKNSALHLCAIFDRHDLIEYLVMLDQSLIESRNDNGETPLWRASQLGNYNSVHKLLAFSANINTKCNHGATPLSEAAANNRLDSAKLLIKKGANVENPFSETTGDTPLHSGALFNRIAILRMFRDEFNASLDIRNKLGESPLWVASYGGARNAASFLIVDGNVDKKVTGRFHWTPLHAASFNGHVEVVHLLLTHGFIPNAKSSIDNFEMIPLHLAASSGYQDVVAYYGEHFPNLIEAKDMNGNTALWRAAYENRTQVVSTLLDLKSNPISDGQNHLTPFHAAASKGNVRVLETLLENDPSVIFAVTSDKQQLAVHIAAQSDQENILLFLLDNSPETIEYRDSDGNTPLWIASNSGQLGNVKLLVSRGGNYDAAGKFSWSPLLAASANNQTDVVDFLITDAKCNAFAKSSASSGLETALHVAARFNCFEVVEKLMQKAGELLEIPNKNKSTALWTAASLGHTEVMKILIRSNAALDARGNSSYTPLMVSVINLHLPAVKLLIESGANTNTGSNNETVLHLAASRGLLDVVNLIVSIKPELLNSLDNSNETPLFKAARKGHVAIISLLLRSGANSTIVNNETYTAFTEAAIAGQVKAMEELLNSGHMELSSRDATGRTPLHWAIFLGSVPAVNLLVKKGANLYEKSVIESDRGAISIHLAASYGHFDVVEYLINFKPNLINVRSEGSGEIPIFYAARSGHGDIVELLLSEGSKTETRDAHQRTVLIVAIRNNQTRVVEILVDKGNADIFATDPGDSQNSVIHLAAKFGYLSIIRYFSSKIDVSRFPRNKFNQTALWLAARHGHLDVVSYLADRVPDDIDLPDENGLTPLHAASRAGYIEICSFLLKSRADINWKTYLKSSMLHSAVFSGNLDMVRFIFQQNGDFDLELKNSNSKTPLCLAAEIGNLNMVSFLIDLSADIESQCFETRTPLMTASCFNHVNIVKSLLSRGASIYKTTSNKYGANTAVHLAARFGSVDVLEYLLELRPDYLDKFNLLAETPLFIASAAGKPDTMALLISKGANIEAKYNGKTPLWQSAEKGQLEAIRLLVAVGANTEARGTYKRTPILAASAKCHSDAVEYLMKAGADVHARSGKQENGNTVVHLATLYGCVEVVKFLVGEDPSLKKLENFKGQTAEYFIDTAPVVRQALADEMLQQFFSSALYGDLVSMKILERNGVDLSTKTSNYEGGETALHLACAKGHYNIVHYLIEKNASLLQLRTAKGDTPLHVAAYAGKESITQYLIHCGSDIEARNYEGKTAFLLAVEGGYINMVKTLVGLGVRTKVRSKDGKAAVHLAAMNGRLQVIEYLLRHRIGSLEMLTKGGETALFLAASHGFVTIVQVLFSKSGNIETRDRNGYTPLLIAASKGHFEIVRLLLDVGANPLAVTNHLGNSLVHIAVQNGHHELVTKFLSYYPDMVAMENRNKDTPLHLAASIGDCKIAEILVKRFRAPVSTSCDNGYTPLLTSVIRNRINATKCLINLSSSLNEASSLAENQDLAIHLAAIHGHIELLKLFVNLYGTPDVANALGQTPLWRAAAVGNEDSVSLLLTLSANLNARDNNGQSPLDAASENGHLQVTELLTQTIMNKSSSRSFDFTHFSEPIHSAAEHGHLTVVKYLLEKVPSLLDANDENNETPLFRAAFAGKGRIMSFLLSKGASITAKNKRGQLPIHAAALNNQPNMIDILLKSKAKISGKDLEDSFGNQPIHSAAISGHIEASKRILSTDPDLIEVENGKRATPLCLAAKYGHIRLIRFLLLQKALVDKRCKLGWTPLIYAAVNGKLDAVKVLLRSGADIDVRSDVSDDWDTVFHLASQYGQSRIVEYLFEEKPSLLELRNLKNNTAIWLAASYGRLDVVRYLTEKGADIHARGFGLMTPYLAAANKNHPQIMAYLVNKGVEISETTEDNSHDQAIHIAALKGNLEVVKYLLEQNSQIYRARNHFKQSPLWKASSGGHVKLIEVFLRAGAYIEEKDYLGQTAIHAATTAGNSAALKYLVQQGGNIKTRTYDVHGRQSAMHLAATANMDSMIMLLYNLNSELLEARNGNGETPLWIASYVGAVDAVRALIDLHVDLSHQCLSGWTPLMAAASRNRVEVIDLLEANGAKLNDVTGEDGEQNFAIHIAAMGGNLGAVKRLSIMTSYADRPNALGETPLWKAASAGRLEVVEFLANYRFCCKVDTPGRHEWTPLHAAVALGDLEVTKYLTDKDANFLARSSDFKYTPIQLAASLGQVDIVEYFVNEHENLIEIDEGKGATPLLIAIKNGRVKVVKKLLNLGASTEIRAPEGETAVHIASRIGNLPIVELLSENGADLSANSLDADSRGCAIHAAVSNNHFDVVTFLLEKEPHLVDAVNGNKQTPLWLASSSGNLRIVILLVSRRSDIESADNHGWTPVMAASWSNQLKTVNYLAKRAAANLMARSLPSNEENSALHLASINNSTEVVEFLVNFLPTFVDTPNRQGNTPLWLAAFHGRLKIVEILVSSKTNINAKGRLGWTPLMAAVFNTHLEVVKYLADSNVDLLVTSDDSKHETAIHLACQIGNVEVTRHLVYADSRLLEIPDAGGETAIFRAAEFGHLPLVKMLIQYRVNLNLRSKSSQTPLLMAATKGYQEIVSYLMESGASFQEFDPNGRTPLHLAAAEGSLSVIKALVKGGAELRIRSESLDDKGAMAIHLAASSGHSEAVKFLVETDSSLLEVENNVGETPLMCAASNGRTSTVVMLISSFGALYRKRDFEGKTPLLAACQAGSVEIIKYLVELRSSLDMKTYDDNSGVHLAAAGGHLNVVKYFANNRGYWLEQRNKKGETPLFVASYNGREDVVGFLLYWNVRMTTKDSQGRSVIHAAAHGGHVEVMRKLLTRGATIVARIASSGDMPIHTATRQGHVNVVEFLVGINPNSQVEATNWENETPLFVAASLGKQEVASFLITQQANVGARNKKFLTPLMIAVINNHLDVIKVLVKAGVSLTAESGVQAKRNTAFHFAAQEGRVEIMKFLLTIDRSLLEIGNSLGATPLSVAASNGQTEPVDFLINAGAKLDARTLNGLTALWRAASLGDADTLKRLITAGADIEAQGNYGRTPLLAAAAKGNLEATKLLIESGANYFAKSSDRRDGGSSALHLAVKFNQYETAKYLRESRPGMINLRNAEWQTPLGIAYAEKRQDMITLLSQ